MSDLIKSSNLLEHRFITSSAIYGAMKLVVLLVANSAHSAVFTIGVILRLIWRIFIKPTRVLVVDKILIYQSHYVKI